MLARRYRLFADQDARAHPLAKHQHVLEEGPQELEELALVHLAQVIRILAVVGGHARVGRRDDELAVALQEARDAAEGRDLGGVIDVLDHLEARHQIERSGRQPAPEVRALLEAQARVAMRGAGPLEGRGIDVQADHGLGNFRKGGGAVPGAAAEVEHMRADGEALGQGVTREMLVLGEASTTSRAHSARA